MDPRVERSRTSALAAAHLLMIEGGLDAITPTRVAERASLGRKTIYRLWPTRVGLLHDVLAQASHASYPLSGDLVTDIRTHLTALTSALTDGPLGMILGALAERAAVDAELAALRVQLAEEGRAPLARILKEGIARGDLHPTTDAEVLASLLEGAVIYETLVRGRRPEPELVEAVISAVVRGVTG